MKSLGKLKGSVDLYGKEEFHENFDANVYKVFEEDVLQLKSDKLAVTLPLMQIKGLLDKRVIEDTPFNQFYVNLMDVCYPLHCKECDGRMVSDRPVKPDKWTCSKCKAVRYTKDLDEKYLSWMWEIFKFCRPREVAFVGDTITRRGLNIGSPKYLKNHLWAQLTEVESPFSFYISLAYIRHTKDGEKFKIRKDNRQNYLFDYVADIDMPTWKKAKKEEDKIIKYLDDLNAVYSVIWSGSKGFHTRIQHSELVDLFGLREKELYSKEEVGDFLKKMVETFKEQGVKLDESVKAKDTQVVRCPYTMHPKTDLICLPLTREQYTEFDLKITTIEYVYDNIKIRDRGLVVF